MKSPTSGSLTSAYLGILLKTHSPRLLHPQTCHSEAGERDPTIYMSFQCPV